MRQIPLRRILIIVGCFVLTFLTAFRLLPRLLPWEGQAALASLSWSHQIFDRNGEMIQLRPVNDEGLRRIYTPWDEIPREARSIIRRSEDRRFYLHPGFDPVSISRAAFGYIRGVDSGGGGSTISMQLARILSPRSRGVEISAAVKIREIWQALQIESRYSKREIMELYINLVPFGRNIEGYPAAARLFFGSGLAELSSGEICILTVIPRAPGHFDPFLNPKNNIEAALALGEKTLSESEYRIFARMTGSRLAAGPVPWPFEAPHFAELVMADMDNWPEPRRRGMKQIDTTLDLFVQREARRLLKYYVDIAGEYRIGNGAMLLADPLTMDVLAYVGSADFHDVEKNGQIDGVRMLREPGSTLKPLLYAEALDAGWTASTILPDIPMEFGGEFIYSPRNYNEQYHGPVRLRQALAASLNIPAVYTLEQLGVESFTETLISAGFKSLTAQKGKLGVSLAVGGGEVSLEELVQGYGALYSGGLSRRLSLITEQAGEGTRVWSGETTDIITDIISSHDERVTTFGRRGPVRFDYPAAIKTGTSNQFNNIWALGFTSDLVGGVWMGNFDGTTVIAAPGSSLPAAVLHEAFDRWSHKGSLPRYTDLETRRICTLSGLAAIPNCPYVIKEIYAYGTSPPDCSWHVQVPVKYPQEYIHWAERYGYDLEFSRDAALGIISPIEGAVYYLPGNILIRLTGSGEATLKGGPKAGGEKVLYQGPLPAELFWPLESGITTFILEQGGKRVSRRIEVR